MMVETILDSSQDFGMSNGTGMPSGALPQWKRELLQRRAARSRPPAAPPAQPPPPPPPPPSTDDDEELRYGPGIVKRLKSRYLSLALRDAPRRRPSVLRRAASLEHLLDERPPPAPAPRLAPRSPRPASVAAPPAPLAAPPRRDLVKRARSVDALSRLDARDEPAPPSPSPPPPPLAPRPPQQRSARPPRRPTPLLRETERPPPDVVRSTLRKFETAPTRRAAPAARVSAVLRGLEAPRRSATPEPPEAPAPTARDPSPTTAEPPALELSFDEPEGVAPSAVARPVSRAALEGIARAGSSVRYAFESPRAGSHLPPLAATNPVLVGRGARRVGVIRPMPSPSLGRADSPPPSPIENATEKIVELTVRAPSPPPPPGTESPPAARAERREPPPSALVEPTPRVAAEPVRPRSSTPPPAVPVPLTNGHTAERAPEPKCTSRIVAAGIERAWSGSGERSAVAKESCAAAWARGGAGAPRRPRAPPAAATSIVFNFSDRKEVPDYIENDGIVLRASRRNRIKAGETGVVVLRPEALARRDSDSDSEPEAERGAPSPCSVRFLNDNVVINGRSSMAGAALPDRDRIAKLKLQFDDSLTRTFEYPSETSLCEECPPSPSPAPSPGPCPAPAAARTESAQLAEPAVMTPLAANTHIASAALSRYTPSKTLAAAFQLGVTRHEPAPDLPDLPDHELAEHNHDADVSQAEGEGRACGADAARSWSEARSLATDLLF